MFFIPCRYYWYKVFYGKLMPIISNTQRIILVQLCSFTLKKTDTGNTSRKYKDAGDKQISNKFRTSYCFRQLLIRTRYNHNHITLNN